MIDLTQLLGLGSVPLVIALVEWFKRMNDEEPPKWVYPALSVACGIGVNLALAYLLKQPYGPAAFMGLIAGLTAAGTYSSAKAIKESL